MRIAYVVTGPYAYHFELVADGTRKARLTVTSESQTQDDGVDQSKGSYTVWVRRSDRVFDKLSYNPEGDPPYRRLVGHRFEENQLRQFRPTPAELPELCGHPTAAGTTTILGRPALHYSCHFDGETYSTDLWLDKAAGWLLQEQISNGTRITATAMDLAPRIDARTFSTRIPPKT